MDTEKWSMFGTINTLVPFLLTLLFQQEVDLRNMILSSVICMMDGQLLPKIYFVGFLNFMVMEDNVDWIIKSCIYVASVAIIHHIPYDNFVHKFVSNNSLASFIVKCSIVLWMLRIGYDIFNKLALILKSLKNK